MENGKDVLKPDSPDRKKRKGLNVNQIEWASMASSSNSEWPEDETLFSKLSGGELKQTVLGQGGIGGRTKIINSNSKIENRYENVQITEHNYYQSTRRNDLDVCKETRGVIIPTSKFFGETTAIRNMENIWGLIIGGVKKKIGVYGMGGIGKTTVMKHINNRILEEKNDKFDCVIWVSVSKESSIFKLQHDIASKIYVNLSNDEDPTTRAGKLYSALKQKRRYLLILDDLWKGYPLDDVGIPDPDDLTSSNICKLVLTTRSLDVCRSMKCEAIKMDLLSKDEAWSLFLHHVGDDVLKVKDLEPIVRGVASKCARLPLALATIGSSMARKTEACDWRDALARLKAFSKEPCDEKIIVIEQLKFSFDRLENIKFQKCLKYCALYPEDYEIERDELAELLTLEGIIEEKESRRDEINECNAILNKLIYKCLLEGGITWRGFSCVKMHDLVRDMTLQIDNLHCQYLAISGIEMKKLSNVKLSENLLKIHISNCCSLNASPMCLRLTTFILHNSSLPNIPDSFFQHFGALKVLKLSYCDYLEVLPDSISNLVNLVGLFIICCDKLRYVHTLAMLKNLQSLEISYTYLAHIPEGLEELSNLRYLNFLSSTIKVLPPKIIPRLSNLQCLVLSFCTEVSSSELLGLKNLEMLRVCFRAIHNLRVFVKHREQEESPLISYKIVVSSDFNYFNPWDLEFIRYSSSKVVDLKDCNLCIPSRENDLCLFPKDVEELVMERIYDLTSLCAIASLNYATDLRFCQIRKCRGVRELVTASSSSSFGLYSLQTLQLLNLENLEALIGRKNAPCNVFPCLQQLVINGCKRIKVLFHVGLLSNLQNLEKLEVGCCHELEEIIGGESLDNDKDVNEAMTCVTLPKLSYLSLVELPNLKSICPPTRRLICESLKEIHIKDCPELEQCVYYAALELEDDSGEPSPSPPSLQHQPTELKLLYNKPIYRKKTPCNVFPCLRKLNISFCKRIKVLSNVGLLSNLKNLETLEVMWCCELEEIIGGESLDNDKDLNEAMTRDVALPKLRSLEFKYLPNLKSICPPTRRLICESLKEIHIEDCPELEQCVYAALELKDSGEPSPSPSLQHQPIELKLYNKTDTERNDGNGVEDIFGFGDLISLSFEIGVSQW